MTKNVDFAFKLFLCCFHFNHSVETRALIWPFFVFVIFANRLIMNYTNDRRRICRNQTCESIDMNSSRQYTQQWPASCGSTGYRQLNGQQCHMCITLQYFIVLYYIIAYSPHHLRTQCTMCTMCACVFIYRSFTFSIQFCFSMPRLSLFIWYSLVNWLRSITE